MTVHRRKVTTGDLTGTESIQVVDGLKVGESISVTAVTKRREDMEVSNLSEVEGYSR
jgi:hypothetical protein